MTALEQVFNAIGEKPRGKHCQGMAGIIEDGKSVMEEDLDGPTMDACLVAAAQRSRALRDGRLRHARRHRAQRHSAHGSAAAILEGIPSTRRRPPTWKLPALAHGGINQSAADAAHPEEDEETGGRRAAVPGRARAKSRPPVRVATAEGAMVLIQLLLPMSAAAVATASRGSERPGGNWRTDSTD